MVPSKGASITRAFGVESPMKMGAIRDANREVELTEVEPVVGHLGGEAIMKSVPGAVAEFEPVVRFHTFGPSSIDFSVVMRGRTFADQFLIKHEFVKALKRAYDAEKITIPFPIVALNLDQERLPDAAPSTTLKRR
jgi:small-conductance mechanosensitive channel